MIKLIIEYLGLYILFIPILIGWCSYVSTFIEFFIAKISKKDLIIYFPEDYDSTFVRYFYILPRRKAFLHIYFWERSRVLSLKNLKNLFLIFSLVLIIGMPIQVLIIGFAIIKARGWKEAWVKVSPYYNLKLVTSNGNVTRNMKKLGDKTRIQLEAIKELRRGLLQINNKKPHAIVYDEESNTGISTTSKFQKNQILINFKDGSYSYTQYFGENKMYKEWVDIKNPKLKELIREPEGDVLKSNYIVKNSEGLSIQYNNYNKQNWIKINKKIIEKAGAFLNKVGGENEALKIIQNHEISRTYMENKEICEKLILNLSNASKEEKYGIFNKYKKSYDIMSEFSKNNILSNDEKEEILKIIKFIEKIIIST